MMKQFESKNTHLTQLIEKGENNVDFLKSIFDKVLNELLKQK